MKYTGIILTACLVLATACRPDEAGMKGQMDNMAGRLNAIEESLQAINAQVEALGTLTQGNVITGVSKDGDGNYVITYKAYDDQEYSVVIATKEQMKAFQKPKADDWRTLLITQQMKVQEDVTEALKAADQMAWVAHMNSIRSRAEEIVLHELIYTKEAEYADT